MKKSFCIGLIIVAIFLGLIVIIEVQRNNRTIQPPFPESWNMISTGMTLKEVRRVVGPPPSDMSEIKTVETWKLKKDGTELVLLAMFYQSDNVKNIKTVTSLIRYKKRDDIIYEKEKYPWK